MEQYHTPANCHAKILRLHQFGPASVRVVLRQGINRQIRRMFYDIGYDVKKLTRTRIGQLRLGDLPRGHWRALSSAEVRSLNSGKNEGLSQKRPTKNRTRS